MTAKQNAQVTFVGAGPGDPGLLTMRATQALAAAEVVISDRAVSDEQREHLLSTWCGAEIEVIDAGFGDNGQPLTHAGRAKVITKAAKTGRRVVRLLPGDGGSFAGLAEEMAACAKAGLPFSVVPGVALHTAVPLYAGTPVTSSAVATVHVVDAAGRFDPAALTHHKATLVIEGSREQVAAAAQAVIEAGRDAHAPALVTTQGTTASQSTLDGALGSLAATLSSASDDDYPRPLVLLAGPTVAAREATSWFETRPLFGWRVLVPRTQAQAGPAIERLEQHGGAAEVVPTISVEPPRSQSQMEKAVTGLVTGRYEWVGFTSVNAVRAVRERFTDYGLDARAFAGLKIAAVGGVTADALREMGIEPDLVPSEDQSAKGLLAEWPPYDDVLDPINRVLLPRADIATDTLVAGLVELGWEVDDVTAYRTVRAAPPPAEIRDAIKAGAFDAVLFTSSSTVRNLVGIAGKPHITTVVACIGPATAKTAEELGIRVDVLAPEPSSTVLVDALAEYGAGMRSAALENGEAVLRPSQRRPAARRKAR